MAVEIFDVNDMDENQLAEAYDTFKNYETIEDMEVEIVNKSLLCQIAIYKLSHIYFTSRFLYNFSFYKSSLYSSLIV